MFHASNISHIRLCTRFLFSAVLSTLLTPLDVFAVVTMPWPADLGVTIAGNTSTSLGTNFEPSEIVWHTQRESLFVVGDEGLLAEIDQNGVVKHSWIIGGDLEGITIVDPSSPYIYLGVEQPDSIKEFDLSQGKLTGRSWDLTAWMTGPDNAGLEALTYVPNASHPYAPSLSGGLFYAGLQADGRIYIFDVPVSGNGALALVDILDAGVGSDISGLCYQQETDTLYAIFDASNVIIEMTPAGQYLTAYNLPGLDQEGVAVLPGYPESATQLYIAEDSGLVKRYTNYPIDDSQFIIDDDQDGFEAQIDCNDFDATVHEAIIYYIDSDQDGLGDPDNSEAFCQSVAPEGFVDNADDPDDTDPTNGAGYVPELDGAYLIMGDEELQVFSSTPIMSAFVYDDIYYDGKMDIVLIGLVAKRTAQITVVQYTNSTAMVMTAQKLVFLKRAPTQIVPTLNPDTGRLNVNWGYGSSNWTIRANGTIR